MAWNIFFPFQEYIKGHPTLEILREMERADRLSLSEMEQLRDCKLQQLISRSYENVPFLRTKMQRLGIKPSDISKPADLQLLPIVSKADMREHRPELRSRLAKKLTPFATGGSTGEPLIFDLGPRRTAARVACRQRVARWWGLQIGDPEIALWGSPIEVTKQDSLRKLRDGLLATRLLSAFEMNEETMSRYLDLLERYGCRQIFAYPSALYLLCLHARKQKRSLRGLGVKVAFVTGEVLFPYQRELIADTFECQVADGYGGRESGFIAHECPQGGMHILSDAVIIEVVDFEGHAVSPGETGEIVVTDLYSDEFPFIRYATGDMGVLSKRSCSCGRPLPLFEKIEGRANDSVVTPDGRIINSLAVIYPVREVEGVEQFRITQEGIDRFHIQIVRNGKFPQDGEDRIQQGWSRLFRAPVAVSFEYLDAIPKEKSGKFRHVISNVQTRDPAPASDGVAEP